MRNYKEIYQEFGIPPSLQEHMLRVWGIVSFIERHWTNKEIVIDWDTVKKAALLHDLGNIVRFDFVNHSGFLGPEQVNVDHWREVQKQVIEKYGEDDHKATEKMLQEIGVEQTIIDIIGNKSFGNSISIKDSTDWLSKILAYADFRTLPTGIGTLEERIADIKTRMPKYTNRPDFEDLVAACKEIEAQISANLDAPLANINEETIANIISVVNI